MKILEYGNQNNPTVILIHGMGCDGKHSFSSVITLLKNKYHIVVPLLDGYDGKRTEFTTIELQAKKIYHYLTENNMKQIYAAIGMSMGGFICIDLFSRYDITTQRLILDSGYMDNMKFPSVVAWIASNGFCAWKKGSRSWVLKAGMLKYMGYCFNPEDLYLASKNTLYNSEISCITYQLPKQIRNIRAQSVIYWYGQKETYMIHGMLILKKYLPNMKMVCVGNVGHGEIMFSHPNKYAINVMKALQ